MLYYGAGCNHRRVYARGYRLARQMQGLFDSDTTGVFELTLPEWQRRRWSIKLSERIMAPLRFFL